MPYDIGFTLAEFNFGELQISPKGALVCPQQSKPADVI